MNKLKERIIVLLEDNKKSGFFTEEIANLLNESRERIYTVLKDRNTFFYDKYNPYVGWRLTKYENTPLMFL